MVVFNYSIISLLSRLLSYKKTHTLHYMKSGNFINIKSICDKCSKQDTKVKKLIERQIDHAYSLLSIISKKQSTY